MRGRKLAVVAVMVLTIACSDTAGPTPVVDGVYALSRLNDAALPYDHEGLGCCTYLAGALELVDLHYTVWVTARNRNTGVVSTAREQGTFAQSGSMLTFTRVSFEVQPLLLSTATVVQNVITLSFGGEGPGAPDQFDAVFTRE